MSDNEFELSTKCKRAVNCIPSYFAYFVKIKPEQFYSPTNPDGVVNMAVAENTLTSEEIVSEMQKKIAANSLPTYISNYFGGLAAFKKELCAFFTRTIFRDYKNTDGESKLESKNIIVGNGAGPLISMLNFAFCEDGEGVLLATPGYAGFDMDVQVYARTTPVYFDILCKDDPRGARLTKEILDIALLDALTKGINVKVLLMASPNNPMGFIYTEQEIVLMIDWCESHKVHLVIDEIYALSCFGGDFVSMATVLSNLNRSFGNYIHFIWSFSKDFCMSGLRLGVLYSENQALLTALNDILYFASTSSVAIEASRLVLSDKEFIDKFLESNILKLRSAYTSLTSSLSKYSIPFLKAESGFFVLIDLSKYFGNEKYPNTFEGENLFWEDIVSKVGVIFTPGSAMHCKKPGYFRICYAAFEEPVIAKCIDKLGGFLSNIK